MFDLDVSMIFINQTYLCSIIDAIKKSNGWGSNITISDEKDEVLETGGGLLKAKPYLQGETFLTINVDILTDVNLKDFTSFHQQHHADITLGVTNRSTSRYLLFDKNNRLCGWRNISTNQERIAVASNQYFQKAYSGKQNNSLPSALLRRQEFSTDAPLLSRPLSTRNKPTMTPRANPPLYNRKNEMMITHY